MTARASPHLCSITSRRPHRFNATRSSGDGKAIRRSSPLSLFKECCGYSHDASNAVRDLYLGLHPLPQQWRGCHRRRNSNDGLRRSRAKVQHRIGGKRRQGAHQVTWKARSEMTKRQLMSLQGVPASPRDVSRKKKRANHSLRNTPCEHNRRAQANETRHESAHLYVSRAFAASPSRRGPCIARLLFSLLIYCVRTSRNART
jgi:hypothetical protein